MVNKSRIRRVGSDFDTLIGEMQNTLAPMYGKKPSYTKVTDSMCNFIVDENIHDRMIRRAKFLASQKRNRGLF